MSNSIDFSGKGLKLNTSEDALEISNTIKKLPDLNKINLEGNTLGIEAAKEIGAALENAKNLKFALLKDLFTGRLKTEIPAALEHLTNGITKANARLEELDLSDNAFGPIGMKALVNFLGSECCQELKVLKLNNNGLGIQGSTLLASVIDKLTKLEVLICGRNRLENEGSIAMSKSLQKISSLKRLEMFQNGIRMEGMAEIAKVLSVNKNLKVVNLNDNTMTESGATKIAEGLKVLSKLKVANFGDCLTRSLGFQSIVTALFDSGALNSLDELVLNGNEIENDSMDHFVNLVLKISNNKLKVNLTENSLSKKQKESLFNKLKDKIDIKVILEDESEGQEDDEETNISEVEISSEQEVKKLISSPETTVDDLCSQIINLSIKGFDQNKQLISEKIIKQTEVLLEATSSKDKNSYKVANSLLVHMGLIKDEKNGKYKSVEDLRGPFLTLKNLSPKLDKTQKDVLQIFIGTKPNKLVNQTGKFKAQLMQSLYV